jgi:uncharacterized protein (DUF2147 family)
MRSSTFAKTLSILGLLGALALAAPSHAQSAAGGTATASTPAGLWTTPDHGAVIQIAPCGDGLCGKIVGMVIAPQDPTPRDWAGDSQCGLTIIQTAPAPDAAHWNGSIVNPRNGSTYHATIALGADHQLRLRGYLGLPIFGQTQTWTAYNGPLAPDCRLPQAAA